jgi:hypothetical protein
MSHFQHVVMAFLCAWLLIHPDYDLKGPSILDRLGKSLWGQEVWYVESAFETRDACEAHLSSEKARVAKVSEQLSKPYGQHWHKARCVPTELVPAMDLKFRFATQPKILSVEPVEPPRPK